MINDDTYKDMLKELHKDKENSADILLEKKFMREKEEEVEDAEVVDEGILDRVFRRSAPKQPAAPKPITPTPATSASVPKPTTPAPKSVVPIKRIDPNERRRTQISKATSDITREKISQANQQRYLNAINKK